MKYVRPVLKWAGGKYRLLPELLPRLPPGRRFVEPFAGSGAVFLNGEWENCLVADLNADLILFHRTLADGDAGFVRRCRELFENGNAGEIYYERRERFNSLPPGPERAALFLYLNRHGYNGLVRYNASGGFNVPFGRYRAPYFPETEMSAFAARARHGAVEFAVGDFRTVMAGLGRGDVAYCDPPYAPLSRTANFTAYSGLVFGPGDQCALAEMAERAAAQGARVAVSNHDIPEVRDLYRGATSIVSFPVRRSISCDGGARGMVDELLAIY